MDTPSFEYQALEADMKTLAAEVQRKAEHNYGTSQEGLSVVKEAIRAFPTLEHRGAEAGRAPLSNAGTAYTGNPSSPLPGYAQDAAPEVKLEIEYLMDMALKEGLTKALTESQKSPYFVQDAFHDALAGRLYPELQKRGLVK